MRNYLLSWIITVLLCFGGAVGANADSIDIEFGKVTNNSAEDLSGQLSLSVLDYVSALADYDTTIASNQVLFVFNNAVGIKSDIHEIYLDERSSSYALSDMAVLNSLGGSTNYSAEKLAPGNLTGGQNLEPSFVADTTLSVDSQGNNKDYLNEAADKLGLIYFVTPSTGVTLDSIIWEGIEQAFNSGDLRVGLHIGSIGADGESDSYVTISPVPDPATMLLIGTGMAGLVGLRLKRKKK